MSTKHIATLQSFFLFYIFTTCQGSSFITVFEYRHSVRHLNERPNLNSDIRRLKIYVFTGLFVACNIKKKN